MKSLNYLRLNLSLTGITFSIILLYLIITVGLSSGTVYAKLAPYERTQMTNLEVLASHPDTEAFYNLLVDYPELQTMVNKNNTTVFVPTDWALMSLSESNTERFSTDMSFRQGLIDYHTLDGKYYSGHLYDNKTLYTTPSNYVEIEYEYGGEIWINNHKITTQDIITRNGVIHLVESVLIPQETRSYEPVKTTFTRPRPSRNQKYNDEIESIYAQANDENAQRSLMGVLRNYDSFTTFTQLIEETGLDSVLEDMDTQITVFVPTNKAFERIESTTMAMFETYPVLLMGVLIDHMVPGVITEDEIGNVYEGVYTADGDLLRLSQTNSPLVENARVLVPNLEAFNGVIHVVDRVITPAQ